MLFDRGFGPAVGPWFGRGLWFIGPVLVLLFIAALIGIIVWLFMRTRRPSGDDPLRLAAARYASGRISREEFDRIRRDLDAPLATIPETGEEPPASP